MPKIPRFDQQRIASSVVGTPGVDTSGAKVFESLAQAAQGVQSQAAQLIQAENVIRYRAQQEQKRKDEELKNAQDAAELAQHQFQLDSGLDNLRTNIESEHKDAPTMAAKAYEQQGKIVVDRYVEAHITDPKMKAALIKSGYGSLRDSMSRVQDWSFSQRNENIRVGGENLLIEYARELGTKNTLQELMDYRQKFDAKYGETHRGVLGAEQWNKKEADAFADGIVNHLAKLVREDPDRATEELSDPSVEKHVPQTRLNDVTKEIRTEARRVRAERAFQLRTAQNAAKTNMLIDVFAMSGGNPNNLTFQQAQEIENKYKGELPDSAKPGIAKITANAREVSQVIRTDNQMVGTIARQIVPINDLVARIKEQYAVIASNPRKNHKMAPALDRMVDQYQTMYTNLKAIQNAIQDPTARASVDVEMNKLDRKLPNMAALFSGQGMDAVKAQDALQAKYYAVIGTAPRVYGNQPRKQAVYDFYYRQLLDREFSNRLDKIEAQLGNPAFINGLRQNAREYAAEQAEKFKDIPRGR